MLSSSRGASVGGWKSALFTASQWEELEQQALVYKYLVAGAPVPPELQLSIRRSYEARFFHAAAALGYCSYYGKKFDPEPGRCRRTDGKKWRCSKDAYPDSKYCERHMHRGRNRSRKPVEAQSLSQSQSSTSSSTVTSFNPSTNSCGGISLRSTPFYSSAGGNNNSSSGYNVSASASHMSIDPSSYSLVNRDFRYLHGNKAETDEHSLFTETSTGARAFDSTLDSAWRLMSSGTSVLPPSGASASTLQSNYSQLQPLQGIVQSSMNSIARQQQERHSFFGSEFGALEPVTKQESQPLRPFFDEWPKTRDAWSDLDNERSNHNSYLTTQLSISIPSDFSTTSRSPHDD